jgi:hypothetical protein
MEEMFNDYTIKLLPFCNVSTNAGFNYLNILRYNRNITNFLDIIQYVNLIESDVSETGIRLRPQ